MNHRRLSMLVAVSLLGLALLTGCSPSLTIKDLKADEKYQGSCQIELELSSVNGGVLNSGTMQPDANGYMSAGCNGAKHTLIGKVSISGYLFDSDEQSPLQFRVGKGGYAYVAGKGSVTMPDGTVVTLGGGKARTSGATSSTLATTPVAVITPTAEHIHYNIPTEGFPSNGPADAPITIVEFCRYQSADCARWHKETFPALSAAYPHKIRLVYRNFLIGDQNEMMSAMAALCAGDQNEYWSMHDRLFSENALLNDQAAPFVFADTYVQFATDLGLNATDFENCLTTWKYKQAVKDDTYFAYSLPKENGENAVSGKPTFFINGTRLVGALPLASFKEIIDAQLATLP
jgi:protein-disulfide isomerase